MRNKSLRGGLNLGSHRFRHSPRSRRSRLRTFYNWSLHHNGTRLICDATRETRNHIKIGVRVIARAFGVTKSDDLETGNDCRSCPSDHACMIPGLYAGYVVPGYLIAAYQNAQNGPGLTMENRWDILYLPSYFDVILPQPTSMACSAGDGRMLFHDQLPAKRLRSTKLGLYPRNYH
jgi:hypothetical protein